MANMPKLGDLRHFLMITMKKKNSSERFRFSEKWGIIKKPVFTNTFSITSVHSVTKTAQKLREKFTSEKKIMVLSL